MKYLLGILTISGCLFLGACNNDGSTTSTSEGHPINKDLSAKEFSQMSQDKPGIILDVRTPEEVAQGIIPGAIHINWLGSDFETKVNELDKNQPMYVYCKSGGRSGSACSKMGQLGFVEVYNLSGGITAWESNGFTIEKQ